MREISPLVGDAGVSIEVFADFTTTAESMLEQGREMFSWIPNAYIKFPCTTEGLKAAETAVQESIRVNMTLCFSQQQVAGVYAAILKLTGWGASQRREICARPSGSAGVCGVIPGELLVNLPTPAAAPR